MVEIQQLPPVDVPSLSTWQVFESKGWKPERRQGKRRIPFGCVDFQAVIFKFGEFAMISYSLKWIAKTP